MEWDDRYREEIRKPLREPRQWLVSHAGFCVAYEWALDVAMGLGNNAAYLCNQGMHVIGVDRSQVAVSHAKSTYPKVNTILADMGACNFATGRIALICNFYFLDRSLITAYYRWLKPAGVVIFETLTEPILSICPDISRDKLLKPGELLQLFHDWEILAYREGWVETDHGNEKAIASIAARKKS